MILLAETPVKYRDGTVKSLDELGGEAKELAPDTPVVNGSTSKPLDEFIQDQIVLSPDTVVVDGEDTTTLEDYIESIIRSMAYTGGNLSVDGTLTASGNTTLNSNLTVAGNIATVWGKIDSNGDGIAPEEPI